MPTHLPVSPQHRRQIVGTGNRASTGKQVLRSPTDSARRCPCLVLGHLIKNRFKTVRSAKQIDKANVEALIAASPPVTNQFLSHHLFS